jgi:hypothetical protein
VRESDSFDDDSDHWGIVGELDDDTEHQGYDCAWWFFSRLALILLVVLFIVWSGVLRYG